MAHKNCLEALDRSLRDILRIQNPNCDNKPFGGKVVVLGGDFRQILPVVKKRQKKGYCAFYNQQIISMERMLGFQITYKYEASA